LFTPARVHTGQARLPPKAGGSCDHVVGQVKWHGVKGVLFLESFAGKAGVVFPVPAEGCASA